MIRTALAAAALLLILTPGLAQEFTVQEFLRSARNDVSVTGFDAQLDWFGLRNYRLPWVNELELRTQNNVMLFGRQQYRMRLDFPNPLMVRNNNRYFDAQQALKQIKRQSALRDAIRDRYLMAVEWLIARDKIVILKATEDLIRRRVEIQRQQAGSSSFNPDTYLEARIDLIARMADTEEARADLMLLENRMALILNRTGGKPFVSWEPIRPETISILSDTLSARTMVTDMRIQLQSIELAERRTKLDRSRIDFAWVQGMYAPYRIGTERNPTGFAVGVTVPIFNRNKNDVARSELATIEEKSKLDQLKVTTARRQQAGLEELRVQLKQYARMQAMVDSLTRSDLEESHLQAKSFDPVSAIRTRVQMSRLQVLLVQARARVWQDWIMLLHDLDMLAEEPWVNFLSDDLKPLD